MKEKMLKVLKIGVEKEPYVKEIENKLEALQAEVGGLIQPVELEDGVLAIINEEGKINGSKPNRWLGDYDIICGDFFLCGDDGENFGSLSDEQITALTNQFKEIPEFTGQEEQLQPKGFVFGFDFY